jgi:hypothetical protein
MRYVTCVRAYMSVHGDLFCKRNDTTLEKDDVLTERGGVANRQSACGTHTLRITRSNTKPLMLRRTPDSGTAATSGAETWIWLVSGRL